MAVSRNGYIMVEFSSEGDTLDERLQVSYMRWLNATSANHELIVKDSSGNAIWKSVADGANFLDIHPLFRSVNGINVDTMDSGSLMVYLL